MAWNIELDIAAKRELDKLDLQVARRILLFLNDRIALLDDPRSLGEALKGTRFGTYWKYRLSDYRLICNIDDGTVKIIVIKIGNRKEVYI
jgi:mRNA interferase RelE/StbE